MSSLLGAIRGELKLRELWVFRGQGEWNWLLQPSLGGRSNFGDAFADFDEAESEKPAGTLAAAVADDDYQWNDKEIFDDWKSEAIALVPSALPRPQSNIEWLAIARHYGLPTRLLDWTRNPLVAMYFAVSQMKSGKDGALFALKGLPALEPDLEDDPWQSRGVRLWHPPSIVERIGRQSGLFTLHQIGKRGASMDLVAYAEGRWFDDPLARASLCQVPRFELVKVRIASASREELRADLRFLGVDEFFAFPDLGGLCRAYEQGRFQRPGRSRLFFAALSGE